MGDDLDGVNIVDDAICMEISKQSEEAVDALERQYLEETMKNLPQEVSTPRMLCYCSMLAYV